MGEHRVVIVGGGFGGLEAARALRRVPVGVTLIDRRNFHLFQPLLYQVATGGLSPANIASPLRGILTHHKRTRVLLGEVTDIDPDHRAVILLDGQVEYDTLIVATGSHHNYFGNDHWESLAPGLKTIEDATRIRRRILRAFEAAERETDPAAARAWLNFVILGAGPTGVELAGAIAELARDTLRHDFRNINPADAQIMLVEGTDRVLPTYPRELCDRAAASLKRLGVNVRTNTLVTDVRPDAVELGTGDNTERVATRTVMWAAGVKASGLAHVLQERAGAKLDRIGRVIVEPDLSLPGRPEILVIGDLAHCAHPAGEPLPGLAPVAMQQGRYAAKLIAHRLADDVAPPFRYRDYGTMATIGRAAAVANLRWVRFGGLLAWLAWLLLHLMYIVEFENRLLVLLQWAWNYFSRNRSARLITAEQAAEELVEVISDAGERSTVAPQRRRPAEPLRM
jgi:NADH dehydrogenase